MPAITAVETVDQCVGELLDVVKDLEGIAVVTQITGTRMKCLQRTETATEKVKTAHTLNPVPFVIYDPGYNEEYEMADLEKPGLSNIAGTLLNLLGYENVEGYDPSLITLESE